MELLVPESYVTTISSSFQHLLCKLLEFTFCAVQISRDMPQHWGTACYCTILLQTSEGMSVSDELWETAQISRDMPHYNTRRWSQQDLEALQHLGKQLRMYCAKIRAALAPIREAVSARLKRQNAAPAFALHI